MPTRIAEVRPSVFELKSVSDVTDRARKQFIDFMSEFYPPGKGIFRFCILPFTPQAAW
jgi:hypothetical protein